ncbi:hypothetical protein CHLNCDRAFT_143157 [Chlorella variabilis]|uniref:Dynamin N-terminal domain-containing protein n=1 Tax=Chlorella variabilis TaxID=554065 RepID=E1Z9L2_CHLVA|nr:hypothetical protein CHLNCDRAFT_143157 [Chlorella variabilis]EFN57538.1 hypothetical protein CHLNCDRAFT_143157 [Chlorella variabilis]|eukprot:XP_005849640.1 hypothetical protein CHLNCDRAFT_143157 [Chlorella variabilis]
MACLTEEVAAVLQQTGDVLSSLVEGSHGSASQNTDLALPSLFRAFQGIRERAAEDQCTLAVLALAKSGKSTLVNAVLGSAVLPSNNVPETARICAIQHTPTAPGPRLAYQTPDGQTVQVEGAGGIREHLRQLNAMGRDGRQGMVADEQPLSIAMPIAALAATPADALSSRITILDTPGPNEAGEDHLRFKVERLMEGVDAVLYILDWSKLKTNEETAMLQRLHELNPGVVRRLCHRCFFVVNKLDLAESSEGMGGEETREYVAALVTSQLNVFLVSARDALRSRLALRPAAAADDLDAFRKVAFGKHWGRVTDPETIRETAVEMLEASGLPELETRVLGFLGRRAALLHLVAVLDDVERLLAQVHNLASASVASLHQGVAALSATVGSLQGRLAATLAQFDDVRREVQELEGLVVDEVRERMGRLRHRLVDQIHQGGGR